MSYAVANPRASSPSSGPPSSATVYDFICLFTHDLRRKQKRWQDGKLKYHSFNKKIMVYDDRGHFVGDGHWDQEGDLAPGDELSLDRGMALVQVEDCTGEKQQDLTELLDKRAREVEKRRQIAAAKTRPTPRALSFANASGGAQPPAPQQQQQQQHQHQRPLSSLVQTPGRIGRAAIPAHSPFEARHQQPRLHQNSAPVDSQPTVAARPPPARKRQASPPSKAGFAKNLFGTSLSLSACPGPELMAARARAYRARMQSQLELEASTAPHGEEETQEPPLMQSSPLFVQETEAFTPPRPANQPRAMVLPTARHPVTNARMAMREAEDAGNRNSELEMEEDEEVIQQENPSKKRRKDVQRLERQGSPVSANIRDVQVEEQSKILENGLKRRKRDKEESRPRNPPVQLSEAIIVDEESDEKVDEAPRRQKPQKEKRVTAETRPAKAKTTEKPPAENTREPKQQELRTTLRMRSRQKRGLLMLREPIEPLPEPRQASPEVDMHERVVKTPSPEPAVVIRRMTKSALPVEDEEEHITIPSSEPPAEKHSPPASIIYMPEVASAQLVAESSSDNGLPPPTKRRATKRRTNSPAVDTDPGHQSEDEPKRKPKSKRRLVKRMADDDDDNQDEPNEEEDEPQRRKRKRRVTKYTYNEEPPDSMSDREEETEAPAKVEVPRIARLARKGIRSKEILGYVPQGIESLIPSPFASATFRLGGPPVVSAVRTTATASIPNSVPTTTPPSLPFVPAATVSAPTETPAPTTVASCPALETTAASPPPAPVLAVAAPTTAPAPAAAPIQATPEPKVEVATVVETSAPNRIMEEQAKVPSTPGPASAPLEQEVAQVPAPKSPEPGINQPLETAMPLIDEVTDCPNIVAKVPGPPLLSRNSSIGSVAPPLSRASSNASVPATIESNEAILQTETTATIPITEMATKSSAPAPEKLPDSESQTTMDILDELPTLTKVADSIAFSSLAAPEVATTESISSHAETNQAVKRRIANPATRGKKAARREDAAGPAPQVMVPFEPVQPVLRMISTRPSGGVGSVVGRSRVVSSGGSVAVVAPLRAAATAPGPALAPTTAKKAGNLPGFTFASEGTWSRHAHDLMGIGRPQRG